MVALDALVVITALPAIHRDLGASLSTLEWTVNAYTLAYAAGIITAAAVGDRFGRRRIFCIGLALFSLASATCALAPSVDLLIAARVVQGIGAAIIMPLSLTILATAFPPERLVWGLVRAGEEGWTKPDTVTALLAGLLLLIGFVAWESRAAAPMLPLRLFGSRTFVAANATGFLLAASLFSAVFLASQYFQFALGFSPFGTGLRFLPWTATPILVAPLAGIVSDRVGQRPMMIGGMLLQGVGLGWFALAATAAVGYASLVLPLLVSGIGASMALAATPTAVLGAVAPADIGKASGANSTFQRFGSVFGIAIATAVFTANGHLGTASSFAAGFRPALALAAGLSIAGALSALAVRRQRRVAARGAAQLDVLTIPAETALDHSSEELPVLTASPEERWEAPVDVA